MMFLLRTAFWLSVVIFLIPVDHAAEQQAETAKVQPIGALAPGFAIAWTVLGLNLLGDGIRDYTDPTLRGDR